MANEFVDFLGNSPDTMNRETPGQATSPGSYTVKKTPTKEHKVDDGIQPTRSMTVPARASCSVVEEAINSYRFATPGGHPGLQGSRASNFQN